MGTVIRYTSARVLLLGVALGLLYLLGARGLLLVGLAVLVSGLASYVLLTRQRDDLASTVSRQLGRVRRSIGEGAAVEDEGPDPPASGVPADTRRGTAAETVDGRRGEDSAQDAGPGGSAGNRRGG